MTSDNLPEPLRRRRASIEQRAEHLSALEGKRYALQDAIENYKAFAPEVEQRKVGNLEKTVVDLLQRINEQEVNETKLERQLNKAKAAKANPLAVWKFFNAEQKKLRAEANRIVRELAAVKQRLFSDQEALSKARTDIGASKKRLSEHENFNLKESEIVYSWLVPEIERIRVDQTAATAELSRIESKIQPHTRELERLKAELTKLRADIAKANLFENELNSASNGKERALIHRNCETAFGTGKPRQVINERRGKVRTLENNIPKLERRIQDELQRLERTINNLLIDGNNICYEGQTFIALRALTALLAALGDRYKITIVFDASIRAILKTDSKGVQRMLGASVITHVAPTKTAADEYLLKLAGNNEKTFILSNDRYAEYHEYDAVKSGRVLRFLIADGKFMANDLDITLSI